jgi:predicted nucleic acid-binding protein
VGLSAYYLADTSAVARIASGSVAARLVPLIEAGLVARCTPTDLEAGFSSRDAAEHRRTRLARAGWPLAPMSQSVLDRAVAVQDRLVARGTHRAVKIADLLIAAAAEAAKLTVLHYDRDFDLIAAVTRQRVEWVVAPGSIA